MTNLQKPDDIAALIERLREDAVYHRVAAHDFDMRPEDSINWQHAQTADSAADALERLTQPVGVGPVRWMLDGLTYPVRQSDLNGVPYEPQYALYSAETVARLIAERDEALTECARLNKGWSDANFERFKEAQQRDTLQEQVKMLRDAGLYAIDRAVADDLDDWFINLKEALAATEQKGD